MMDKKGNYHWAVYITIGILLVAVLYLASLI